MKENYIHVCFIIDESGSMCSSINDVVGGFKRIIEEQAAKEEGQCSISMYTFNNEVTKHYIGKNIKEVSSNLRYCPGGGTALNDGVGTAIDEIGEWLNGMEESEKPSSNLIVIMTDGEENCSKEYSLSKVKEMIKHQTEKYNWTFMYLGADITTTKVADSMGIKYRGFSTKMSLGNSYENLGQVLGKVRCGDSLEAATCEYSATLNSEFEKETGIKLKNI